MQHMRVLDKVLECQRRVVVGGEKHRAAGHARNRVRPQLREEVVDRLILLGQLAADEERALHPRGHHQRAQRSDGKREPTAGQNFGRVRCKQNNIDQQERAAQQHDPTLLPAPQSARDHRKQHRGDRHQSRHRNAVRASQTCGRRKQQHGEEATDQHQSVHIRNVDLSLVLA